jgi:hypothetical protein
LAISKLIFFRVFSVFSVVAPNIIRRGKTFKAYVRGLDIKSEIIVTVVLQSGDGSFRTEKQVTLDPDYRKSTIRIDVS